MITHQVHIEFGDGVSIDVEVDKETAASLAMLKFDGAMAFSTNDVLYRINFDAVKYIRVSPGKESES